jgi:hypothetical protein
MAATNYTGHAATPGGTENMREIDVTAERRTSHKQFTRLVEWGWRFVTFVLEARHGAEKGGKVMRNLECRMGKSKETGETEKC